MTGRAPLSVPLTHTPPPPPVASTAASRAVRRVGTVILLALVVFSPWPFASADPAFESLLSAGAFVLVALWAVHAALTRRLDCRFDVVTAALAGLVIWTAVQLVPLPEAVVGVVAPARLAWHRDLTPEVLETFPGDPTLGAARPTLLPLTVDPAATRLFLARMLGLLLVYAAVRNWLATRESLTQLSWAMTANGAVLALVALGQFFTGSDHVLGLFPTGSDSIYGPFINRNHYPDYAAVCLGLAVGLMLTRPAVDPHDPAPADGILTPRFLGLAVAAGLMAVSIPFSLSRGGTVAVVAAAALAWLLARPAGAGRDGEAEDDGAIGPPPARFALAGVVAVGGVLFVWFGSGQVEKRFNTLTRAEGAASRLPLWRDAARLVPAVWPTGTGAGTFAAAEPTVRTQPGALVFYENAHNEYLEALVEGGVVRLGLTGLLAGGVLVVVGRGYVRRRGRSVGPRLAGLFFGLAVVVIHAVTEFAVHMPAVAFAAAVAAGFGVAAAVDPAFVPARVRVRKVRSANAQVTVTDPAGVVLVDRPLPDGRPLLGPAAGLTAAGLAVAALFCALETRRQARAERLKIRAEAAFVEAGPDRHDRRAELYSARAALVPDDPTFQYDAGQAHLAAAVHQTWTAAAGLAGGAAGFVRPPAAFTPAAVADHVAPAGRHFQRARAAGPLTAKAHGRLAVVAPYFASGEPAAVHLARTARLFPADPDVWFAVGREALGRHDLAAARAAWRRSLELSPEHLPTVLAAVRDRLTEAEIRDDLLPDDPTLFLAAADALPPDRAADRRPYLERVLAAVGRRGPAATAADRAAEAAALDDLDRPDDAAEAWLKALSLAPDRVDLRERYARWLERDERYDDAIVQLEWLRQRGGAAAYQERYEAARHGRQLQREIRPE